MRQKQHHTTRVHHGKFSRVSPRLAVKLLLFLILTVTVLSVFFQTHWFRPPAPISVPTGTPAVATLGSNSISNSPADTGDRAGKITHVSNGDNAGYTPNRVAFEMSADMDDGWRTSSKRMTYRSTVTVRFGEINANEDRQRHISIPASITFYGKSSLKLKYTKRRSLHVQTSTPIVISGGDHDGKNVEVTNYLLLSLWEDEYRVAYQSAVTILRELGLFFSASHLVEVVCTSKGGDTASSRVCGTGKNGKTLGVYLLVEYPSDAIMRRMRDGANSASERVCESDDHYQLRKAAHSRIVSRKLEVATRNWFYFEKPSLYDLLHVPSYARNSSLSPIYRKMEASLKNPTLEPSSTFFDMEGYMMWVAVNSLLKNGDYDDEVLFYGHEGAVLSVMAWDYDSIFSPCHRKGANAVKTPHMYCAETPVEKAILSTPELLTRYQDILRCVSSTVLTDERWASVVTTSAQRVMALTGTVRGRTSNDVSPVLRATFDESPKCCPDPMLGAKELAVQFHKQRLYLTGAEEKKKKSTKGRLTNSPSSETFAVDIEGNGTLASLLALPKHPSYDD